MSCDQPIIYPNYQTKQIVNGVFDFLGFNNVIRNWQTSAGANFTLNPITIKPGGKYRLLISKTIAGDVLITLPPNSIIIGDYGNTAINLSGAQNEKFLIEFTFDNANFVFEQIGSGGGVAGPTMPTNFNPYIVPFIDNNSEFQENLDFNFKENQLVHPNLSQTGGVLTVDKVKVKFFEWYIDLINVFSIPTSKIPFNCRIHFAEKSNPTENFAININSAPYTFGNPINKWDDIEYTSTGPLMATIIIELI